MFLAVALCVLAIGGGAAEAETKGTLELAFLSERSGGSSVLVAGAGSIKTIARNTTGPPVWFRDGKRLAFTDESGVQIVTLGERRRSVAGCRGNIALAPNARSVICEGSGDADAFHHVNLITGHVTLLGSNDDGLGDTTPQDPAWAVDGTIALIPSTDAPIFLYRLRGSGPDLRLSRPLRQVDYPRQSGVGAPHDPDYSPDGRWLAFTWTCDCRADERNQIWIADARSGKLVRRVTSRGWGPSWSPTGGELAFASDMHGDTEIYTAQIDGRNIRRMTFSRGRDTEPAWRPVR